MSTQIITPANPLPLLPEDPQSPHGEAERQRVERRKTYGTLLEFIKNTTRKVENEDASERLEILKQQNRCQAYYDDRQSGKWNDIGEWEATPYDPDVLVFFDNRYKEQVDKLQMEMARSAVDLESNPVDQTDSKKVEAAKFFKSRIDANRRRLFTQHPEFVLAENMSLLIKTITFRYVYFDANAKEGPKEKRPTFGKLSLGEDKNLNLCAVCGVQRSEDAETPNDAPTPCPKCGSTGVKNISTSPVEIEVPNGEEEVPCGLVRCAHVDPTMVQVSLNARNMDISSSPYLVWTQMVERGKLELMFPDRVIPTSDDRDEQQKYRRDNEIAVSNSSAWGFRSDSSSLQTKGGEQFERLKFKLIWIDSWVYGDYKTQKTEGERLPDGRTLPPDVPLIQFFPNGMCIAKVGDTPLMLYSEDKNKKWSMCVYGLREHAIHGSGTNSLIPIQNNINDLLSYRMKNAYDNTARREFFAENKISGDNLPTVDQACGVTNLEQGDTLPSAVYGQAPGIPLPPEVVQLAEEQKGSLQEQAGTSSLSMAGTSAESQALGTATGIAAIRDMAVGRIGPSLMLKAAMEVETAFQCAELEQKNYSPQHLFALAGLKPDAPAGNLGFTADGVEEFINSDLRADFIITPIQGSWMPTTEQEKKADALAMADVASKVENPEILSNVARVLKQPLQIGGWGATEREASRRLEEFGKVATLLASHVGVLDEMATIVLTQAKNAAMSVEMDDHPVFMKFYREWWVSDEARNAPSVLKRAVEMRYIEHKDAMVENVQDANARAIEGQLPNKVAEAVSGQAEAAAQTDNANQAAQGQTEQAGLQQQMGQADREHEAQVELGKQAESNRLAAQDREHALQTKAADREHAQMMKERAANQVQVGV